MIKEEKRMIEVSQLNKMKNILGYIFLFFKKVWLIQNKAVFLHHQNPPSLSTMLKCAGRFFIQ